MENVNNTEVRDINAEIRKNRAGIRKRLEKADVKSSVIDRILKKMDEAKPKMFTESTFEKVDGGILNRKFNFSLSTKFEDSYFFNHYRAGLVHTDSGYLSETMVYNNGPNIVNKDELVKLLKGGSIEREIDRLDGVIKGWVGIDTTEEDKYGYPILKAYTYDYNLNGLLKSYNWLEKDDPVLMYQAEQNMRNGESANLTVRINDELVLVNVRPNLRFNNLFIQKENGVHLTQAERQQILLVPENEKSHEQKEGLDASKKKGKGVENDLPF